MSSKLYTPRGVSTDTKKLLDVNNLKLPSTKEEYKERLREIAKQKQEEQKDRARPITIDELEDTLSLTVKHDSVNKKICFLSMLLNYTEEDQSNIGFNAESSTGKSYIPLELSAYFPQEDVTYVAYSSPTSFFHDYGKWDEDEKVTELNWHQQILIFLDQPHDMLLQRMRPILSHDRKEMLIKITDRSKRGSNRTKSARALPASYFSGNY